MVTLRPPPSNRGAAQVRREVSATQLAGSELDEPGLAFLPKPFTAHALAKAVREVLDNSVREALNEAA